MYYTDPSAAALSITGDVFFRANAPTLAVMFDVSVVNVAPMGDGNDVLAISSSGANFAVEVYLSDMDASVGTLGLQFTPTCTGLSSGVLAGSAETITLTCTVDLAFTDTNCQQIQFICARLLPGADAEYTDNSNTNNIVCADVSGQRTCTPGKL